MLVGYGFFAGILLSAMLLFLTGLVGLSLSPWPALALLLLFAAIGAWRLHIQHPRVEAGRPGSAHLANASDSVVAEPDQSRSRSFKRRDPSGWTWLLIVLLSFWLGLRLTMVALELWWQPLFPWDAWTTWALRARVWTELQALVPFIAPDLWLATPASEAYTIEAHKYPLMVSLISTWTALAVGAWNESAAKLPWIACAAALALAFFGQARLWGATAVCALSFLCALFSLPILNSHIALAGYADLWMAALVGLAFMAFLHWVRMRDWRDGLLCLVLVIALPFFKDEGFVWALSFLLAMIVAWLPSRWWLVLAFIGAFGSLLMLFVTDLEDALPVFGGFKLQYQGQWQPVWEHLFQRSSWHLFWFLFVVTLIVEVIQELRGFRVEAQYRAGLAWVLATVAALYLLFFWTEAAEWAAYGTSINRVVIHFVPAIVFWMLVVWLTICDDACRKAGKLPVT